MDKKALEAVHPFHRVNAENWRFLRAAYKGTRALVDYGVLERFKKDEANYQNIIRVAYGFNYSKRIVNTVTDFLRETPFENDYGDRLGKDAAFADFQKDCDLKGTDIEIWWASLRRVAAKYGFAGVLVDRPSGNDGFAYFAAYSPLNILDWRRERDEVSHRDALTFLKLRDTNGFYRIWTPETWEVWELPEKEDPRKIAEGANPLGEIPFIWFQNGDDTDEGGFGISDIEDIARIDASIIVDGVSGTEILKSTSFPMFIAPREEDDPTRPEKEIRIGPREIFEFDPETPNAKPFWLQPEAAAAIEPMIKLWDRKKTEIYEMANLSGIVAASTSKEARSAESFQQLFRFLNAQLSAKVDAEKEARLNVIRLWLKWQNMEERFEDVSISHSKKFDVEKFIREIGDILTAKTILAKSPTAQNELDKRVVRRSLTDLDAGVQVIIDKEIEAKTAKKKETSE